MRKFKLLLLVFLPLSFVVPGQVADAPEVVIKLKSGGEWKGEILSVRDQTLILSSEYGKTEKYLERNLGLLTIIKANDIHSVKLPGNSNALKGMGAGGILGCISGYWIGSTQPVSNKGDPLGFGACSQSVNNGVTGCMVGGGAGLVVGGLVGASLSRKDSVISGPDAQDMNVLKTFARYQGEEPEFLKTIGR